MDFIDWCHIVLDKTIEAYDSDPQASYSGVHVTDISKVLFDKGTHELSDENEMQSFVDALSALKECGFIYEKRRQWISVNRSGRDFIKNPIPFWESICAIQLQEREAAVLNATNNLSPKSTNRYAWLTFPKTDDMLAELNLNDDTSYFAIGRELADQHKLLKLYRSMDSIYGYAATYKGLIWQTRRDITSETKRLDELVAEWETTSVDFKRELKLDTASEKAEFIKDVIALANTQASGKRYLIIGFDDKTRNYHTPVSGSISSNRIEQILANHTKPMINVKYQAINYKGGTVGQIEILRNAIDIPYKVSKSIGDKKRVNEGDIFVRHGTQIEPPTPGELSAIEEEAAYAKSIKYNAGGS
ncbi:hypothetical protein CCAX7_46550 [Capsulimonas corticalis]|uniref:Uncharacterized protein n=1 Tax=Capsulimonas corticalis TaxID=2219043 RepID=A0A402D539_9BACT|nr:ATP-binding protein [Capsulimonas corticalis]BDI32604.1 hypothetical protein CCAX7_46550 [Capsulimonas corticalis]